MASQLAFGFVGGLIGVGHACIVAAGSLPQFWQSVLDGDHALPAARVGPEILVIALGVVFATLAILLFTFTIRGLLAGLVGWLGGVVAGGLYDLVRLRGTLAPREPVKAGERQMPAGGRDARCRDERP